MMVEVARRPPPGAGVLEGRWAASTAAVHALERSLVVDVVALPARGKADMDRLAMNQAA
jgi:hypothetical protein